MWEAIQSNQRRARLIVAGMAALLVALGGSIGALLGRQGALAGVAIALGVWLVLWLLAAFQGDRIILAVAGAQRISHADAPQLFNVVEEMTIASGLGTMPEVYVIPDDRPNAFAAGRTPQTRVVCVTSGLLRLMTRDELQGVIGHEIGHHRNNDPKLIILMGVMMGAVVLISELFLRGTSWGGRSRSSKDDGGGAAALLLFLLVILLAVLAPVLAQLMYFALSRRREYLADASAARFTRYPEGLASALEKISVHAAGGPKPSRVLAPMYIVNPMEALAAVGLFSTHPPTADRIRILRSMGGGVGYVDYDAAFQKIKGRSCIGRRTLSEDTPAQARAASAAPAEARHETVRRSQEVTDLVGRIGGLTLMRCACGVGIKVPAGASWTSIPCPRCGRQNEVPKAMPAADPEGPARYQRKGTGWESFQCACGAGIQLSPSFEAPSLVCGRCGRKTQILPPG